MTGHRIPYAGLVAKSLSDFEVVVCLPERMRQFEELKNYFGSNVTLDFYPASLSRGNLFRALEARRHLLQLVLKHKPKHIAIPTGDGLANVVGLAGLLGLNRAMRGVSIDICLMKGRKVTEGQTLLSRCFSAVKWKLILRGPWRRVLLIDPRAFEELGAVTESDRVFLCPDPVPKQKFHDKEYARRSLGLPTKGKLVVSVGNQSHQKGTDLLLKAFRDAEFDVDAVLVIFGKINSDLKPLFEEFGRSSQLRGRLITHDRFVTEDEFQLAIIAADLVALPYRSCEQPSGIFCRSIAWQRPVIVTNRGWLKWIVEKCIAGECVSPENIREFGVAMNAALVASSDYRQSSEAVEFVKFNTEKNYIETWRNGVDS
jgi:glycosyltransferase involved in cell wall biosynthesis